MKLPQPILCGTLLRRYKRFLADVRLDSGQVVVAHCPNSGSMLTCGDSGATVALSHHPNAGRKLEYTWELTKVGRGWIGVNTAHPNAATAEAAATGVLAALSGYESLRREVPYGRNSRIDILLEGRRGRAWVEVKNVTLKDRRMARFPDAETARGLKHLNELRRVVKEGDRGVLVFFVNRPDVDVMGLERRIDPEYAKGLTAALRGGVEVVAAKVKATLSELTIVGTLPVDWSA